MKKILKKYGIKPLKRLGQNFLVNRNVLKKIIDAADLKPTDIVLEIGPGLGTLSVELAKRVKQVIAIEKDKKMCEILGETLNIGNIQIINQDILKFTDYELLITNYKIIANLPYYITSPVIRKFLEAEHKPELMVLMVQKEVAQRICAKPGKMSLLSVAVQFYAQPEIISYVSKKSFYPQPKVDSSIIKIVPRSPTSKESRSRTSINTKKFFELVKAGFSSKRKFLINNLSRELKIENCKLKIIFDQIEFGQKLRAQELSIQDWLNLFHKINFIDN